MSRAAEINWQNKGACRLEEAPHLHWLALGHVSTYLTLGKRRLEMPYSPSLSLSHSPGPAHRSHHRLLKKSKVYLPVKQMVVENNVVFLPCHSWEKQPRSGNLGAGWPILLSALSVLPVQDLHGVAVSGISKPLRWLEKVGVCVCVCSYIHE